MQSSSTVIGILFGIVGFLLLIFYWGRFSGIRSNTRLYMRRKSQPLEKQNKPIVMSQETQEARPDENATKSLNILFMYNGHTWDAYEILGIPAGSSLLAVEKAYLELKKKIDPQAAEFVDTAYKILKKELNRRPR